MIEYAAPFRAGSLRRRRLSRRGRIRDRISISDSRVRRSGGAFPLARGGCRPRGGDTDVMLSVPAAAPPERERLRQRSLTALLVGLVLLIFAVTPLVEQGV